VGGFGCVFFFVCFFCGRWWGWGWGCFFFFVGGGGGGGGEQI